MRDEDGDELLPEGSDDCFDESLVDAFECLRFDGPATEGDDLESFVLLFEVLEELLEKNNF